jgi:hypothetical protein
VRWSNPGPAKHQALIDAGLIEGVSPTQNTDLPAAKKRVKAFEDELQLLKEASEPFDRRAGVGPQEERT